jgi:hypothetical protein
MPVVPLPAFPVVIQIAPDVTGAPGTYVPLGGTTKCSFAPKADLVDKTYFGSTGARDKFQTIRDGQIQLSGQFPGGGAGVVSSDAAQQTLLGSLLAANPKVWVKILWDGTTHGPSVQGIVPDCKLEASVAGAIDFSATVDFTALPTYA